MGSIRVTYVLAFFILFSPWFLKQNLGDKRESIKLSVQYCILSFFSMYFYFGYPFVYFLFILAGAEKRK